MLGPASGLVKPAAQYSFASAWASIVKAARPDHPTRIDSGLSGSQRLHNVE